MPSAAPQGEPAPVTGELPGWALDGVRTTPFGVYVHVPFCRVRCGYCDFNTYTAGELAGSRAGDRSRFGDSTVDRFGDSTVDRFGDSTVERFVDAVLRELDLAASVLGRDAPPVRTVFVGGGTPTILDAGALARLLDGIRERWGLTPGCEVTTEANPDTVTPAGLQALAAAGYTRVSLGMQSAVPHVLAALDRTHDPDNVAAAVRAARAAGLQVSVDLIYGTPGESMSDWQRSLDAALALGPDHLSAYALVVEEGTRLAARVRRGELAAPDDDDLAAKYELADTALEAAGFGWYEVSSWSRGPEHRCRHNLGYWTGATWWGAGPGAHSHVGGVRWWNVRHPAAYQARLAVGTSPAAGRERLDADERYAEWVLLGIRLREGLATRRLRPEGAEAVSALVRDGLLDAERARGGQAVLTRRGRLLADTVVRTLLG